MRDEFYADRRDLWKWTIALNEAAHRNIVYVAMCRRSQTPIVPKGVRDDVGEFFVQEWKALNTELRCARIVGLNKKIVPLLDPYIPNQADEYFGSVCRRIASRTNGENLLVFVDPDTGIAEGNPTPKHVSLGHLELIWRAMHTGDALLVYQHNLHESREQWVVRKQRKLAEALRVSEGDVKSTPHGDVHYFCVSK